MTGYGGHSETERVLVNDDRLVTLNLLKIQSGLTRNGKEIVRQLTKPYNADFDGDKSCRQQGALKACNSLVISF